jgi:heptosyltransferase-1
LLFQIDALVLVAGDGGANLGWGSLFFGCDSALCENQDLRTPSNLRLLVVRLGAMGDILHALPAVTALRQAHPEWVIDWVAEPHWQALLTAEQTAEKLENLSPRQPLLAAVLESRCPAQPLIDRLHLAPTKQWRMAPFSRQTLHEIKALRALLRAREYDAVIDLQGAIRSAVVARLAGGRRLIGEAEPRERVARWLFTERVATRGAHVIEQDLELASAIAGDRLVPVAPWLPVDPAAEAWAETILPPAAHQQGPLPTGLRQLSGNQPAVLINPGAGWGAKRWPAERYAAVAQGLVERGCRVLVNAGPDEEPLAEIIVHGTGGAATPLTCTLAQLIALTRRIALVVAGDTGPLHLACALGRPVVGVYGPTDPSRNGPFGTEFEVLRSPRSRRDHSRRKATEAGLLTIQPEEVLRAAERLLYPESATKHSAETGPISAKTEPGTARETAR